MQRTTNEILIPTSYCVPHEPKYCQRYTGLNTFPYCKTGIHCYCSRSRVWGAYGLFDGPKHLPCARRRRGYVDVDVGKPIGAPRLQLFALTAQKTAIWRDLHSSQNVHRDNWLGRRRTSLRPRGLSHCQFKTSCTSAPHDAAAPTVTGRARGWAVLAAELPVACRQRAEPVVTDGCAHPKPWAKGDGTTPRRRRHLLSTTWPWRAREDVRRRRRAAV